MPQSSNMTLAQATTFIGLRARMGAANGLEKQAMSPALRNALLFGGGGLATGLIGTAMSNKKEEDKQYLRNAVLSGLLGAGVGGLGTIAWDQGKKLIDANSTGTTTDNPTPSPWTWRTGNETDTDKDGSRKSTLSELLFGTKGIDSNGNPIYASTVGQNVAGNLSDKIRTGGLAVTGAAAGDMMDKRLRSGIESKQTLKNLTKYKQKHKALPPSVDGHVGERILKSNPVSNKGSGTTPLKSPSMTVPFTGGKEKIQVPIMGGKRKPNMAFQQHTNVGTTTPGKFIPTSGQQKALRGFNANQSYLRRGGQHFNRNKGKYLGGLAGAASNALFGGHISGRTE